MGLCMLPDKLLITSVHAEGTLPAYNRLAVQPIEVGDQILTVNGVTGTGAEILDALQRADTLTLKILKSMAIDVQITKFSGILGLNVKDGMGGAMVNSVDTDGAVDKWNAANPDKVIRPGMVIIVCNGRTGHAVVKELQSANEFKMVILLNRL